jgi:hypothetical protein
MAMLQAVRASPQPLRKGRQHHALPPKTRIGKEAKQIPNPAHHKYIRNRCILTLLRQ